MTDLEIEVGQLRETLTMTSTEVTRLKFKEKELEQAQVCGRLYFPCRDIVCNKCGKTLPTTYDLSSSLL